MLPFTEEELDLYMNCKESDLVSCWIDDDSEVQAKIAYFIYKDHNPINTKFSKEDYDIFIAGKEFTVIQQFGMPDSMWYRKEDEDAIMKLIS